MKSKNLSEKILRLIKSKGYKNIELEPVIETKYILKRSGENFKRLLFSFYDLNGKELCLRPDLTISSVLRFVQNILLNFCSISRFHNYFFYGFNESKICNNFSLQYSMLAW